VKLAICWCKEIIIITMMHSRKALFKKEIDSEARQAVGRMSAAKNSSRCMFTSVIR
jgi:hypothetical protein